MRKPVEISGTVIRGLGLGGKKLETATMNLSIKNVPKSLKFGIYAVLVKTKFGLFKGVCHYGPRPAVNAGVSFEVHCFGLKKNMYRRRVSVEIIKRLRAVRNFKTTSALKKQIELDKAMAQKILTR